jgi:hypothetical protein
MRVAMGKQEHVGTSVESPLSKRPARKRKMNDDIEREMKMLGKQQVWQDKVSLRDNAENIHAQPLIA